MNASKRILVAVVAPLLLAGCGGGDGDSDGNAKGARTVDRAGYFSEAESDAINPVLADFNTATANFETRHEACNKRADKLFKAGKPARATVQCHLDQSEAIVVAIEGVGGTLDKIEDDVLRGDCVEQLDDTRAFVDDFRNSWKTVHGDWERYADGKEVSSTLLDRHLTAAVEQGSEFVGPVLSDLTRACYTKADREAAKDEADTDPATKEPDDPDA
jgi:hypothetical protein